MAYDPFGTASRPGIQNGFYGEPDYDGPPPSTLAAQLVENISASSRSLSRPDEDSELKRLASVVNNYLENPDQQKTPEEHVEHNHLLIYVCCGVALDSLKWDDPLADPVHLRTVALKAINFFKVMIKETPAVLTYTTDGTTFLFRNTEPLWLWILPKMLKIMGHSKALPISGVIESLCQDILLLTSQSGCVWGLGSVLMQYFRENVGAIFASLKANMLSARDPAVTIELPPQSFLETFPNTTTRKRCFYTLKGTEHAARQAAGLLMIIKNAIHPKIAYEASYFLSHHTIWLLDSIQTLLSLLVSSPTPFGISLALIVQTSVEIAGAYQNRDVVASVMYQKANTTLAMVCGDIFDQPCELLADDENGMDLRRAVCFALVQLGRAAVADKPISGLVTSCLLTEERQHLLSTTPAVGPNTDVWRCFKVLHQITGIPSTPSEDTNLPQPADDTDQCADDQLRSHVNSLVRQMSLAQGMSLAQEMALEHGANQKRRSSFQNTSQPLSKRRRLEEESTHIIASDESTLVPELFTRLHHVLGDERYENDREKLLIGAFPQISEDDQCQTIDLVTRVSCACDNTLEMFTLDDDEYSQFGPVEFECSFCGESPTDETQVKTPENLDGEMQKLSSTLFSRLLQLPSFLASTRPRIFAMTALRRVVRHSNDPGIWDLEKSVPGQWCLQSLQSSIRELRIAAGRALAIFLEDQPDDPEMKEIVGRNRANALGLLKTLSGQSGSTLHETCIQAWGQVGGVVSDEELNLVLIKLVEYLGHDNTVVSAFAVGEILSLAARRGVTTSRLFQPFWASLAFSVVKDLALEPRTTKTVADLLSIGVPELLRLLERHALPWLVLAKKPDVIQKFAESRGETESWQRCLETTNLPSILALLLIQNVEDVAGTAMALLRKTSSHFDDIELVELLQTDPHSIALELFKAGGEANEESKTRVRTALVTMATILLPDLSKERKSHIVGRFLQQYALALVARLSEVIAEPFTSNPPVQEQRRCLAAMELMITICKTYVSIARPQISSCLISAMASDELRSAAFSCWAAMLTHMEEEDTEALIETTSYLIIHYWERFDENTQTTAEKLIKSLLKNHKRVVVKYANKLPSLRHISKALSEKLDELRKPLDTREAFWVFAERLNHENPGVVEYALVELVKYLKIHQTYLQTSALSEQPDAVVTALTRSLLDCSSKFNGWQPDVSRLCAEAIGLVGCLDSNRLETMREQPRFVVIYNFDDASETTDFVSFMLENVLVKAFLSTTDTRFQGFLAFAMQYLLDKTDFKAACQMKGQEDSEPVYRKWMAMSPSTREVLTPFLTSQFSIQPLPQQPTEYPIFRIGRTYASWLRVFVGDLLRCPQNVFSQLVFSPLQRLIKVQDLTVAEFLLPYVVVHVVVGHEDSSEFRDKVVGELVGILNYHPPDSASDVEWEEMKRFYEAVFRIIDYSSRWLQIKNAQKNLTSKEQKGMHWLEQTLASLNPELVSKRAIDCKEYARALYFLEPHIESKRSDKRTDPAEQDRLLQSLLDIYTQVDDPDGLEGMSAQLQRFDNNLQALNDRKAGRWTAAQNWYQIRLAESPNDIDLQLNLLTCLKESGEHNALLNCVENLQTTPNTASRIVPFAVEAAWATGQWQKLTKYLRLNTTGDVSEGFNVVIGHALLALRARDFEKFEQHIKMMREKVASSMTYSATLSLQTCHDAMLKCHVLSDLEMIANEKLQGDSDQRFIAAALDRRLGVLGAYVGDKQYLLTVRRAAMHLLRPEYRNEDISSVWLNSAQLARKAGSLHQSYHAVLQARKLGDGAAIVEHARLMYKEGHHPKAIQLLQQAIDTGSFHHGGFSTVPPNSSNKSPGAQRNLVTARAHLLLAKWLDSTGQTQASALRSKYQQAAKTYSHWEKGHYYLGRHYKKVLESETTLEADDQSDEYLTGETAKLVIENYLRSLCFGTKYLYQTLPRILTLWLELGAQVSKAPDGKVSVSRELYTRRKAILNELSKHFTKFLARMPAFIFYTALPQIVARIAHPNPEVFKVLEDMIIKVVEAYPRQALWSLFSFMTTKQANERRTRGLQILATLRKNSKSVEGAGCDLKSLLRMGEKLAEQLLMACNNGDFQSNRTTTASISRDLQFNHKCTPCPLVVPIEACLSARLPTLTDNVRKHVAFSGDVISIDSFLDSVLVLGSLAKPRKLTARGSDGKLYGVLLKPKDDLRTDQRLMEFNGQINRSLKRDAESSRRQLYIKTYAVTPLNEECGIIEWVDGLKTLRDILLAIYKSRNISPNYNQIAQYMKEAISSDENITIFTETVLGMFPPVLPDWFISQFPNPSAWFSARLRYTRSCAVMSMVGTILGLGDRHGENVLLEEGNGGIFHVDFNCLFDKGLTFAQPERVPFRLTHNMTAAMGIYRYEGPFRHCSELTLRILRQQEETLLTILEAFIHDPTLDLQRAKKRSNERVKLIPTKVVDNIKRKVRGLLPSESIPLGVEGQVDELIKQAVNPTNLAAMYIGWCPFL
ncbi:phosphatidyl inositol 3-kinase-like protein [Podospora didyma]|uniref:non-specific serine/threonine protein kinase n=1 Tax=Podospora didyma TaxID=330526 RepID=A0AAE0K8H7_9PEZI|nr:phosphatidyl inositol 3-kinase-like protein [Podospora didyma]